MKGLTVLLGIVLLAAVITFSVPYASAADFTASISPTSVNGSLSNQLFNLTVNNTDTSENIIQVNVTLPGGFVFVAGSNQTTASNNIFYNTSSVMAWENTTASGFIDVNGTVEFFIFNSTTPGSSGNYTITLQLLDTNYSSNSTSFNITVDADSPNITLSYPGNNTVYGTSNMTFNFTVTDTIDDNLTCDLTIDSSVNQSGFGAESGNVTSRTVYGLNGGQHEWNVTCWDDFNHTTTTNISFFTIATDLSVTQIKWNSTESNHPGAGSNITINATINNTGDFNFTGDMEAWLYWDGSKVANETISNTTLTSGTGVVVIFDEITSDALVTNGEHTVVVEADPLDSVTEYNETNNNMTIQLLVGFNVTIKSMSNSTLYANESLNITVSVEYANGDPVNNLAEANFTIIYDDVGGGSVERNWGTTTYQGTSVENFTNSSNGVYWFSIVSYYNPTAPGAGVHNITVGATGGSYSGSSNGLDSYYLLVPSFTLTFGSLMTSINEEYIDSFNIYATNAGTANLYNTSTTINDNHDYLTFTSCSSSITVINDSNQYSVCNPTMTALAVTSDQNGCFSASVGGKSNGLYFNVTSTLQCVDVLETGTGSPPGGGPTGGTTCTTDADCATGYYCSTGGTCLKKAYSISITSYTSSLEVNWSSYVTTKVTVKNDGTNTFTAKLTVTLTGLEVDVLPSSMNLNPGNAIMFTLNISAPETASVGSHSGTVKAFVDEDSTTYQSKPITVNILTTAKKKEEMNKTYYNYSSVLDELKELFDRLKSIGFINQSDLDEVESLINSTINDLGLAKDAIDDEDYSTADSILAIMNSSLNSIRGKIEDLQAEQQTLMGGELSGAWLWVVIGVVVVIVVVFLIYLFLPTMKRPRYGAYGYKPVIREGFFEKLGKVFKREKKPKLKPAETTEKPSMEFKPAYREGYEKVKGGFKYREGRGEKVKGRLSGIKEKFKRKKPQKEVTDYFASEEKD